MAHPRTKAARHNQLRVIGGRWRGRRLRFPDVEGLRPTPDRVRETLFNWLAPCTAGARCLDLFAGSGALGIEALSRGAAQAIFVECDPRAVRCLRENLAALGAACSRVEQADALAWLQKPAQSFDLVLLDPPFGRHLYEPACALLESGGWLAPEGRIYLETERTLKDPCLPDNWEIIREKAAGEVAYRLIVRRNASNP